MSEVSAPIAHPVDYKGAWSPTEDYQAEDVTVHAERCWLAVEPVQGLAPAVGGWDRFPVGGPLRPPA